MKPTPVIGQTLYSVNVGNAARNVAQKATPIIVRSVGRKYFSCSTEMAPHHEIQFHLDTWGEKTEFCVNRQLYASEQEWQDEKAAETLYRDIKRAFDSYRNTHSLTTLRAVWELVKPTIP